MATNYVRLCGYRLNGGGLCGHPLGLESTHCSAQHPVKTLTRREKRAAKRLGVNEVDFDVVAGESGTIDIEDIEPLAKMAKPIVKDEKPLLTPEEQAKIDEEMRVKQLTAAARSEENAQRISAELPENVITIDMDGTIFDSWACCKRKETNFLGDENCRHLRQETIDEARKLAEEHNAALVVLSWRGGLDSLTREWLEHTGLQDEMKAVFIPGGSDDITGHFTEIKSGKGQVDFKVNTVKRLMSLGHNDVASFEDRNTVVKALEDAGVKKGIQVKYKYSVKPHEWNAGYVGAPRSRSKDYRNQPKLFGSRNPAYNSDPYDYNDALWDDDRTPAYKSRGGMSRYDFEDLVDSGHAIQGRDYTIDKNGEIRPLQKLRDENYDTYDEYEDGDLSQWVIDRWGGQDDLMFLDSADIQNENPF